MIEITITGRLSGNKALLYELPGRQGRRTFVPTYSASVRCFLTGKRFDFAVTRDSSAIIFGEGPKDRYGEKGECPPCADAPYLGAVREDGTAGFRVECFEGNHQ